MEGEVVGQSSPFLSTDPNAGAAASPFLSSDPNAGQTPLPVFRSSVTVNGKDISLDGVPNDQRAELASIADRMNDPNLKWDRSDVILDNVKRAISAWGTAGPHRVVEGLRDMWRGNYAKGANSVINGGLVTAAPMLAPEVIPLIAAAPGETALMAAGTTVAGAGASSAARAGGATPDQADLVGTVTGLGAGALVGKLGVPALAKWSANNKAIAMGDAYAQSTRDIQAALGVKAEDVHLARPFLEAVHANGIPIVGKEANGGAADQLVKAADAAVNEIEAHVATFVQQFPNAVVPASDGAVLARVSQMQGATAADQAAARSVIKQYGLDRPRSLADAEGLRARLNAENRATLDGSGVKQRDAVMTDPKYVARQQAADSLRDGIYGKLEDNGVEGIRDLRRGEGAVIALRNKAIPLTTGLRSEGTVARTGETSLARRVGQHVIRAGSAAAGAYMGGPVGAGVGAEIGDELGAGLTTKNLSKNALLERAFAQSFTSPPVMSVQGIRPPVGVITPSPMLPAGSQPILSTTTNISQGYRR